MIDVKKNRNNFQKFPLLKQRCNPVIAVKPKTAVRTSQQPTTTSLKNNTKNQANDSTTLTKSIHSTKATNVTASPTKCNNIPTNSNPVREANQHFFLVPEFKDRSKVTLQLPQVVHLNVLLS